MYASKQLLVVFKKILKLSLCVWTRMTWPWISESTFFSKISSHISWKTTQLSKRLSSNIPLTVQRFELNAPSPGSPCVMSLSTYWKLLRFLKRIWFFFLWFLNHRVFYKFIQFKNCVKSASHYFNYFNGFTDS